MKRWIRYFRGYVYVVLTGETPERFLNLCRSREWDLWELKQEKDGILFYMDLKSFFQCKDCAKKAGIRLRVRKRFGFPFFLFYHRKRKLWLAGFILFFLMLLFLSAFLWDIEIRGNKRYTENQLVHFLETLNISCGIPKHRVCCEELEEKLREEYPEILWASVRVSGTRLYIHIKENEVALYPEKKENSSFELISEKDAVITSLIVKKGLPLVREGESVKKGQPLVTGRIPIRDDSGTELSYRMVHPEAEIRGICKRKEEIPCRRLTSVCTYTGRNRRGIALKAGKISFVWMLPNAHSEEWNTSVEYHQLRLFGDYVLPVYFGTILSREISKSERFYTQQELEDMAYSCKKHIMEKLMEKGVHIIENNVKILVNGLFCRFCVELTTEESLISMSQQGEEQFNEHY